MDSQFGTLGVVAFVVVDLVLGVVVFFVVVVLVVVPGVLVPALTVPVPVERPEVLGVVVGVAVAGGVA